jgi:hypothetical protein
MRGRGRLRLVAGSSRRLRDDWVVSSLVLIDNSPLAERDRRSLPGGPAFQIAHHLYPKNGYADSPVAHIQIAPQSGALTSLIASPPLTHGRVVP